MTRKSAASAKVKRIEVENSRQQEHALPSIEETFEGAKEMFLMTAEVAHRIARRADNMYNVRRAVYEFWGNHFEESRLPKDRWDYIVAKTEMTSDIYSRVVEAIESFELEEFLKEDMKNYFEDIVPDIDDLHSEEDLFDAWIAVEIVKPWGEKMAALHQQMLQEKKAREQ